MARNFKIAYLIIALLLLCVLCLLQQKVKANQPEILRGGQVDYSFKPAFMYPPLDPSTQIAFLPDGKILSAGKLTSDTYNTPARKLVKFFPNGDVDTSFNPYYPVNDIRVDSFTVQSDGKIIYSYYIPIVVITRLIRINADGTLDPTFSFQTSGTYVSDLASLPNSKTLVTTNSGIKRLNSDGTIDVSFNYIPRAGSVPVGQIIILPDNRFYAIERQSSGTVSYLTRHNSDGSLDLSFGSTDFSQIFDYDIQPNGNIFVLAQTIFPINKKIIKLNPDGTVDVAFRSPNDLYGNIAVQNDGRVLVNSGTKRLLQYGVFDSNYSSTISGSIYPRPDGKFFIVGMNQLGNYFYGVVKVHGDFTPTRQKAFDFDGDGKADISLYRPSNGTWYWINSSNNNFSAVQFGLSEDKPVPADYDGDTKADIAVYRPSSGVWHFLSSSTGQYSAIRFGISSDLPTPSDYDGDGKDDVSVFRPSTGVWYRLNSSDNQVTIAQFGNPNDRPIQGDFDGDGKADLAVWGYSNSTWSYRSSIDGSMRTQQLGYDTDRLVPGDYDGDGRTDYTIWRSANAGWYGLRSSIGNGYFLQWGVSSDIPIPADYDGDGRDDIAVYRPSTGTWWIGLTSNGNILSYPFGLNEDIPLPSTFVR